MLISDWSSDVCSSDLVVEARAMARQHAEGFGVLVAQALRGGEAVDHVGVAALRRVLQAVEELQGRHRVAVGIVGMGLQAEAGVGEVGRLHLRSEEHTSELQSLMRSSYAVVCLKKKKTIKNNNTKVYYKLNSITQARINDK